MTHQHHIEPVKNLVLVWVVLIILTFTTWGVATIDLGPFNILVAITIAVIKMSLVIWIFMGVKAQNNLTRLFVVAGFFWFFILIVLMGQDYISRDWLPVGKMW